jgi:cell division protein FtsQ
MRRLLIRAPRRFRRPARIIRHLAIPVLLLAMVSGLGFLGRAASVADAPQWIAGLLFAGTAALGFGVEDIVVEGRRTTLRETVLDALAARRGTPIFAVDLERAKQRLEALPWVHSATIVRRLPGTLHVKLVERQPLALWQHDGKIELIDRGGTVIPATRLDRFAKLPLVVGTDAAGRAAELLAMLGSEPELASRVTAAILVGGRRWNLRIAPPPFPPPQAGEGREGVGMVDIMLPEDGAAEAWARLARLEHEQQLLERQIDAVDLRLPDRLVLKLPSPPQPAVAAKKGRPPAKNI